jgi:membrane-associated HD superfamily phosphohydrolase
MNVIGIVVRGFIIWIIPLVISFFFYSPQRELVISYALFKSIMVVVLTVTTLGVNFVRPVTRYSALAVALAYTAINLLLDMFVLLPMTGMSLNAYLEQIALVYVIIFAVTWGMLNGRNRNDSPQAQRA